MSVCVCVCVCVCVGVCVCVRACTCACTCVSAAQLRGKQEIRVTSMERQIGQHYLDIWCSRERLSALKNVRVNVYLNVVHVNV